MKATSKATTGPAAKESEKLVAHLKVEETPGSKVFKDPKAFHQQSYEEGVKLKPKEESYLLRHFFMMVVGKPGSGKTSMVVKLLTDPQFYGKKFDRVVVISPSHEKMGLDGILDAEKRTTEFDIGWIFERILEMNMLQFQRLESIIGDKTLHSLLREPKEDTNAKLAEEL